MRDDVIDASFIKYHRGEYLCRVRHKAFEPVDYLTMIDEDICRRDNFLDARGDNREREREIDNHTDKKTDKTRQDKTRQKEHLPQKSWS